MVDFDSWPFFLYPIMSFGVSFQSSKNKHKCEGRMITVKWIQPPTQVFLQEDAPVVESE